MNELQPTPYYTWLMLKSGGDPELLSVELYKQANTNKQAQRLLELTNDKPENSDTFKKAANMLCTLYYDHKKLV